MKQTKKVIAFLLISWAVCYALNWYFTDFAPKHSHIKQYYIVIDSTGKEGCWNEK